MTTITFQQTTPILRIFDVSKAREFYVDFLGFQVDWEHRFEEGLPLYMQVSRGNLVLHLSEHHGDACPGAAIFVTMSGRHQCISDERQRARMQSHLSALVKIGLGK